MLSFLFLENFRAVSEHTVATGRPQTRNACAQTLTTPRKQVPGGAPRGAAFARVPTAEEAGLTSALTYVC